MTDPYAELDAAVVAAIVRDLPADPSTSLDLGAIATKAVTTMLDEVIDDATILAELIDEHGDRAIVDELSDKDWYRSISELAARLTAIRDHITGRPDADRVILAEMPAIGDILVLTRAGTCSGELYDIEGDRLIATIRCDNGDDDDLYDQAGSTADQHGWVVTGRRTIGPGRWMLQGARQLDSYDERADDALDRVRSLRRERDQAHAKIDRLRALLTQAEEYARDLQDDPDANPAYILNIAQHDGYLYLECGECDDRVTGIEPGAALTDLLAEARQHHELYHREAP